MIQQMDPVFSSKIKGDIKNCSIGMLIDNYSIENLVFEYARHTTGSFVFEDNEDICKMRITQARYELKDNYKLGLVGVNDRSEVDNFYISDFNCNIRAGYINIYNKDVVLYKSLEVVVDPKDIAAIGHIHGNVLLMQKYLHMDDQISDVQWRT